MPHTVPNIDAVRHENARGGADTKTVAGVLVGVLEQIVVKHIFGLIGDSLNPLADAVRRSDIEWIGVRHQEGAPLAAAGQARLTVISIGTAQ